MPEYMMLCRFTQQGITNIKESPKRVNNVKKLFESEGAKVKSFYVVLGQYDALIMLEAPDDKTVARLSLQVGSLGNVHIETLPAFNEAQYAEIIEKMS